MIKIENYIDGTKRLNQKKLKLVQSHIPMTLYKQLLPFIKKNDLRVSAVIRGSLQALADELKEQKS